MDGSRHRGYSRAPRGSRGFASARRQNRAARHGGGGGGHARIGRRRGRGQGQEGPATSDGGTAAGDDLARRSGLRGDSKGLDREAQRGGEFVGAAHDSIRGISGARVVPRVRAGTSRGCRRAARRAPHGVPGHPQGVHGDFVVHDENRARGCGDRDGASVLVGFRRGAGLRHRGSPGPRGQALEVRRLRPVLDDEDAGDQSMQRVAGDCPDDSGDASRERAGE
mmetsp:Transcript_11530/g.53590  ORF Transcript_11530/g.53590 Transcript_11530/m.53590 type:complete len:223 (-) Transcript_11530:1584-2252(-)